MTLSIAHVKALKQGSQDSQNQKERYALKEPLSHRVYPAKQLLVRIR